MVHSKLTNPYGNTVRDASSTSPSDNDHDDVLALLARAPYRLVRPNQQRVPFVVASPHSGRSYPKGFLAQSRLSFEALRRSEDAFVEELFAPAVEFGAPLIAATFPRVYLDVNRAPAEFDTQMFAGPLPFGVDQASPRVHAGLGVIPRIVREGAEIYAQKLPVAEAVRRMALFYRPYHAALAVLVEETMQQFGCAVVIDCHSMPSAAAVPDIVLGDRYGMSASPLIVQLAEDALARQGFSVARNMPYAGGYTTQLHGRPGRNCHALQIEINRALYMDEDTVQPGPEFPCVSLRLKAALKALTELAPGRLSPLRHAAE